MELDVCGIAAGIVIQLTHSTHDDIRIGNANVCQQRQDLIHDLLYEHDIYMWYMYLSGGECYL